MNFPRSVVFHIKTRACLKYFVNGCSMSLTIENEMKNRMFFLDLQNIRESKKSTTSTFRKPTFSEISTRFERSLPSPFRFGTVYTLGGL